MYILYLDDSGSPGNRNVKHFVLGGFIIHEKNLYWINKRLEDMADNYRKDNAAILEFHASEIVGGRAAPWDEIKSKRERIDILKNVLSVAADCRNDVKILACAVEKESFPEKDPVALAFEDLCSRFQHFLQRKHSEESNQGNGLIILDKSSYETTLQEHAKDFRTLGNKWGITTNSIQEVPLFVDSKASRGIQLADHIAYSVFRRYEHGDLICYNVIEGCFDANQDRMYGLCHKTQSYRCTCPYCIQKKYCPSR